MLTLVAYDVPDDKRRLRIAKILEDFGTRVQYSVFECHLETRHLERLKKRLSRVAEDEKDSIRIYRLCRSCVDGIEIMGGGVVTPDPEVYIV